MRVSIRHQPEHLIVLARPKGGSVRVVYNGCGEAAWNAAGKMASNGQRSIAVSIFEGLFQKRPLEMKRAAPI